MPYADAFGHQCPDDRVIAGRHLGPGVGTKMLERVSSGAERSDASFGRIVVDAKMHNTLRYIVMVILLLLTGGDVMTVGVIASGGSGAVLSVGLSLVVFGFGSPVLPTAVEFLHGAVVQFLVFQCLFVGALQFVPYSVQLIQSFALFVQSLVQFLRHVVEIARKFLKNVPHGPLLEVVLALLLHQAVDEPFHRFRIYL